MTNHRLSILAAAILIGVTSIPMTAVAEEDFLSLYNEYLFHQLKNSPRSAGMGNAYSALQGADMSFSGNPASLGFLEERYVGLEGGYEELLGSNSIDLGALGSDSASQEGEMWDVGIGVAYPFEWGGLALNYGYRDDDVESENFNVGGARYEIEQELERHNVSLTGGYRVNEQFAVGYRYSYITWDQEGALMQTGGFPARAVGNLGEDFDGHRNHAGLQYMVNDCWVIGFDGMYGLGERDFDSGGDADADSWFVRGGMAYTFLNQLPLTLAMDIKFEQLDLDGAGANVDEEIWGVHLGAEYEVYEQLFLRAGYQLEDFNYDDGPNAIDFSQTLNGLTGGLGYEWNDVSFDYSIFWNDTGHGGDLIHVFGVGYHF